MCCLALCLRPCSSDMQPRCSTRVHHWPILPGWLTFDPLLTKPISCSVSSTIETSVVYVQSQNTEDLYCCLILNWRSYSLTVQPKEDNDKDTAVLENIYLFTNLLFTTVLLTISPLHVFCIIFPSSETHAIVYCFKLLIICSFVLKTSCLFLFYPYFFQGISHYALYGCK